MKKFFVIFIWTLIPLVVYAQAIIRGVDSSGTVHPVITDNNGQIITSPQSFGAATATPNPTQGPSMLATIQAQLNAISTAIPVPTVNVSVSGTASTPVPAQTLTAVTIVFSPTPQTAVIVPTPTGGSGINYVYRLRILQPGVSNPIQVGLTSNATPIPGAGGITNEIDDLTFSSWYASQNGKDISATANAGGTVIFDLWTSPNPWTGH